MDSVIYRSARMCLGNVMVLVVVLTSSENLPQVPMEPLEADGHSPSVGHLHQGAPVGFFFQLGELPCTEQSEAESQMLQGFTGGSCSQVQLFGPVPGALPDLGEGKSSHCVIPLVAFSEALRMLSAGRQLIPERQERGTVPVHMPGRLI